MKHNKWFEETFLASLKDGQWISEKQMSICKKYMIQNRYNSDEYYLICKNTEHHVYVYRKGYGKYKIEEFPYNIEYDDGSHEKWLNELDADVQRRIKERRKELATKIVKKMKESNPEIDVEKQIELLANEKTGKELKAMLNR